MILTRGMAVLVSVMTLACAANGLAQNYPAKPIRFYTPYPPGGTTDIAKLNTEMARILNLPDIKQRLIEMGSPPVAGTPDQFGALIKSEIVKWGKVVKQAHVSLE